MTEEKLKQIITEQTNSAILTLKPIGQGAVGKVYLCELKDGKKMAIKFAPNKLLMDAEYKNISYISERTDFKLPKVYFVYSDEENQNLIAMEYFDGKNANEKFFLKMPKDIKQNFAKQVIENLLSLQKITNTKFGTVEDPKYSSWLEYYKPFANKIMIAAEKGLIDKKIPKYTVKVMRSAIKHFDLIFDEPIKEGVLTHGDYWLPNMIVDENNMNLLGVVDPFNLLYADKEYDLFPLIAANGNRFKLLDMYKSKVKTTVKCDLKLEFYALFSEIYWFTKTDHIFRGFVIMKARHLKKQLKRFNIPLR